MKNMQLIREIAELQGMTPTDQEIKNIYIKTANEYISNILKEKISEDKTCNSQKTN